MFVWFVVCLCVGKAVVVVLVVEDDDVVVMSALDECRKTPN